MPDGGSDRRTVQTASAFSSRPSHRSVVLRVRFARWIARPISNTCASSRVSRIWRHGTTAQTVPRRDTTTAWTIWCQRRSTSVLGTSRVVVSSQVVVRVIRHRSLHWARHRTEQHGSHYLSSREITRSEPYRYSESLGHIERTRVKSTNIAPAVVVAQAKRRVCETRLHRACRDCVRIPHDQHRSVGQLVAHHSSTRSCSRVENEAKAVP